MRDAGLDFYCYERRLWDDGHVVVGVDEVGRGALAGPLTVGAVVLASERPVPDFLDDSKRLTSRRRELLVPRIRRWCDDHALGSASASEIDHYGLMDALGLATRRALAGLTLHPTHILLDGSVDFLAHTTSLDRSSSPQAWRPAAVPVTTIVGGDATSALIAAASVLAKVHRDQIMTDLAPRFAAYGWERNKGYGTSQHLEALRECGPSLEHRTSWRLPIKIAEG
ncbi:MAG TPA: ribonuclease HII [Acidimicrobiales bacterium]|nr:ribonuclease HII [Acidimicrobiales bacterium]